MNPRVVGCGLVMLDLLEHDGTTLRELGGSCGNVLSNLAYLGWEAHLIDRLNTSGVGGELLGQLQKTNVDTGLASIDPTNNAPVLRRWLDANGKHTWEMISRYQPLTLEQVKSVWPGLPAADVYFFDRANPASLLLARYYKDQGSLIVFEPSSVGDQVNFESALLIAHIVKYADERFPKTLSIAPRALLEIRTSGGRGLDFWARLPRASGTLSLGVFPVTNLIDPVGAGDWTSAGLLQKIATRGYAGLAETEPEEIMGGLRYGQALASLNCQFKGARGLSREMEVKVIDQQARLLMAGSLSPHFAKGGRVSGNFRVLVSGSRDWKDEGLIQSALERVVEDSKRWELKASEITLIHGDARGLDRLAGAIAARLGMKVEAYPVTEEAWRQRPGRAALDRNTQMLQEGDPHLLLAFPLPQSRGTWDMVEKCQKAGVKHRVIGPLAKKETIIKEETQQQLGLNLE